VNKRLISTTEHTTPITFVVETPRDAAILRGLLDKSQLQGSRFFGAQGQISLASLARNILVQEGVPVMVITDAGAAPGEQVLSENLWAIESVEPPAPFSVFVFSPSLDCVAAEATGQLDRDSSALDHKASAPPGAPERPDSTTVDALRKHPQVRSFMRSLAQLQSNCAWRYEIAPSSISPDG
jgi:hypothetical protein